MISFIELRVIYFVAGGFIAVLIIVKAGYNLFFVYEDWVIGLVIIINSVSKMVAISVIKVTEN